MRKIFRISIFDITLSGMFIALYIIFGLFPIKIPGVMRIGLDFVILAIIGLTFGVFKGVFISIIADLITTLINGIGLWMWQYSLINIGVVILSALFLYVIKSEGKKFILLNISIAIAVFSSFYITFITINLITVSPHSTAILQKLIVRWSIIIISIIMLILYIILFIYYIKKRTLHAKNMIVFFSLSSLILILFSWIFGSLAFIGFMNRLNGVHTYRYDLSTFETFLIPRILKSFLEIPIYTILIYTLNDLIMNKLHYKNTIKNKYE